jgi:hypothetical protein
LIVFLLAGLCAAPPAVAIPLEYRVKAAFLFNFTKFVEWPAAAFPTAATPFSLCVVGFDAFGDELARILANRAVQNHRIEIRRLVPDQTLPACHMLFLSGSAQRHSPSILAAVAASPTLSVGEGNEFIKLGGCIRFLIEEGRVKFEINPAATDRAGLKVSSKLLRLGRIPQGSWL